MQEVNNTSALEEQLYYIGECKKFLEKKTKEIGRPLYACVHTFGCQMNARDSEKLLGVPVSYTHLTLPTICSV